MRRGRAEGVDELRGGDGGRRGQIRRERDLQVARGAEARCPSSSSSGATTASAVAIGHGTVGGRRVGRVGVRRLVEVERRDGRVARDDGAVDAHGAGRAACARRRCRIRRSLAMSLLVTSGSGVDVCRTVVVAWQATGARRAAVRADHRARGAADDLEVEADLVVGVVRVVGEVEVERHAGRRDARGERAVEVEREVARGASTSSPSCRSWSSCRRTPRRPTRSSRRRRSRRRAGPTPTTSASPGRRPWRTSCSCSRSSR